MIDPKFVQMLRCPNEGTPLEVADESLVNAVNLAIEQLEALDRLNQKVELRIEGGLCSGLWLYPIRDGIPTLVTDDAIAIGEFTGSIR